MELTYDWKNFQSIFYTKRKLTATEARSPVFLVTKGSIIVAVFSEGENLSDWIGATYDEIAAEFSHREIIAYEKSKVDQTLMRAAEIPHLYDQIQFLRSESKVQLTNQSKKYFKHHDPTVQRQFLLQAVQGWWNKVLPSSYGIFLRLDNEDGMNLFILIQRGNVKSFLVPDLSGMMADRRRVPSDVVKFLSERYLVPVQGLFITSAEWSQWSESPNPWPSIAKALRASKNKLVPFNLGLVGMIAARGYLGF